MGDNLLNNYDHLQYYRGALRMLEMFWNDDKSIDFQFTCFFEGNIGLVEKLNEDNDFDPTFIRHLKSLCSVTQSSETV